MKKELKSQIIESISANLGEYQHFYIVDIAGLNAQDTVKLRRACFENEILLTVVKNTLFNIALKNLENEEVKTLSEVLEGNTAIMYCNTGNAPAKLIKKLLKDGLQKPLLKGAFVQQGVYVGADKLDELAAIKSKEELLGDIIAMLQSPIQRVISGLENKAENGAEASEEAPAAEAPAAE